MMERQLLPSECGTIHDIAPLDVEDAIVIPKKLLASEAIVAAINTLNATLLKNEEKSQKRHEEVMEKSQNHHEEQLEALWGAVKFMVRF